MQAEKVGNRACVTPAGPKIVAPMTVNSTLAQKSRIGRNRSRLVTGAHHVVSPGLLLYFLFTGRLVDRSRTNLFSPAGQAESG